MRKLIFRLVFIHRFSKNVSGKTLELLQGLAIHRQQNLYIDFPTMSAVKH